VLRALDLHIEFRKSLSKYLKDQKYLIAEVEGGVDVLLRAHVTAATLHYGSQEDIHIQQNKDEFMFIFHHKDRNLYAVIVDKKDGTINISPVNKVLAH